MSNAVRQEMPSRKAKIMVVDDEPFNLEIMQEILETDYEVSFATSGPECLKTVKQIDPSLILLDINMPGMSGYEVCQQLKKDPETQNISITFVSALDTLAERLAGYEVGGDDYITKPFEARELLSRIGIVVKNKQVQRTLEQNAASAISTAMTAMTSTSELGVVLQFLRASFQCENYRDLAMLAVDALNSYDLRNSVQIRVGGNVVHISSDGKFNQLEATVLQRISKEDRIIDIGSRTVVNYEHVSLLIKGMPKDDVERYGRIKDNIALLAEGAQARVNALLIDEDLKRKQTGLVKMVQSARQALNQINDKHEDNKIKCMKILADLIANVERSFSFLGLSEQQEKAFLEMVNRAVHDTIELYNDGLEIDARLAAVMEDIKDIMQEQS